MSEFNAAALRSSRTDLSCARNLSFPKTRSVNSADIPALIDLDREKWGAAAASEEMLRSRIAHTGGLGWGVFDEKGRALASCFVLGATAEQILSSPSWNATTCGGSARNHVADTKCWFGISLSGRNEAAVEQLLHHIGAEVLRRGIREIYLGSTLPGFSWWKRTNPEGTAEQYAAAVSMRNGVLRPVDPLLQYYAQLGFAVVKAVPDYFPHDASGNNAALIRFRNPLAALAPVFRLVPCVRLRRFVHFLF